MAVRGDGSGALAKSIAKKLHDEAEFLRHIRDCNSEGDTKKVVRCRHLLHEATDKQLRVILDILYLCASGKLIISQAVWTRIKQSKRLPYLQRNFERIEEIREIVQGGRKKILEKLYGISTVLPALISTVFYRPKKK